MKTTLFVIIIGAALCASMAQAENTYTAKSWDEAISNLPCDAFKKNPDGSWTITGKIILGNGKSTLSGVHVSGSAEPLAGNSTDITISDVTLQNTRETPILEQRCAQR